MELERIRQLIELVAEDGIAMLEIEESGCRIRISRSDVSVPGAVVAPSPTVDPSPEADVVPDVASGTVVTAPGYGVFHCAAAPGTPPFVIRGQAIVAGAQLGLIEAMKTFTPVKAAQAGRVDEILVADGAEVEAGMPLFRLS